MASDSNAAEMVSNLFSTLVQPNPKTLVAEPDIAERWEVLDGGLRWRFYLRESGWSDGRPVTAGDYEYSWKRAIDPATLGEHGVLFNPIRNAAAFQRGDLFVSRSRQKMSTDDLKAMASKIAAVTQVDEIQKPAGFLIRVGGDAKEKSQNREKLLKGLASISAKAVDSSMVGVKAIDDRTLEVSLEAPTPYFLSLVMYYAFSAVPRHLFERLAREGIEPSLWTRPEHIVTNGAFHLKEWKFRQSYLCEPNPYYWNAKSIRFKRIRVSMVESDPTTINMYRTADFDWVGKNANLPIEFMSTLEGYKDFIRAPYLSVYYYWFNIKNKALSDRRLRQALSLAVDRASLVKYVTRGGQIPTANLVPVGLAGYKSVARSIYDPEKARTLLVEAGYPAGKNFPNLTIRYNTAQGHKQIAEAIQQMWKKNLGVEIGIENQEWQVYLRNLRDGNFEIGRMGWVGDYPDPVTFLDVSTKASANNYAKWFNPHYEALLEQSRITIDPSKRLGLLAQAETILLDELPMMPLYVYTRSYLKKPYLRGFWPNLQDRHPWKYFWIDERFYAEQPIVSVEDPAP